MGWGATFVRISILLKEKAKHILMNLTQDGGFESINLRSGEVDIEKKVSGETCGDYAVDTEFKPATMICATNTAAAVARKFNLFILINILNELK